MFRGINAVSLDTKGRVAVPTRYRARLTEAANCQLVVTIDTQERCLLLYPQPDWEVIEGKIEALSSFNAETMRIKRLLMGHATDVEMDKNGRILVPPPLREYAGLSKKAIMVGQGKKFEIWDEGHWHEMRDAWLSVGDMDAADMPDELRSLSL